MAKYVPVTAPVMAVQAQVVSAAVGNPALIAQLDAWTVQLYQQNALWVGANGLQLTMQGGQLRMVNPTDWIVQQADGSLQVLDDASFQARYVAAP